MITLDPRDHEEVARAYIATFAGRTDAYVAWTGSQYVAVRRALTAEVFLAALQTKRPVGGYFLRPDNRSHVAALDFDRSDGWDLARLVGSSLWTRGVPAYAERSRGGRAHLWIVVGSESTGEPTSLPAIVLRHALRAALAAVGLDGATDIELRPGSDRLTGPDGLGHALRLPTMPHKETGERHPLCDPRTGASIGRTLGEMLPTLETAPTACVIELAERYCPPAQLATSSDRPSRSAGGPGPIDRFNAHVGVCEVLQREFGLANAYPGRTVHCPAHDDRAPSLSIAHDDARVWCHAPGCPLEADGRGQDAYGLWALARSHAR